MQSRAKRWAVPLALSAFLGLAACDDDSVVGESVEPGTVASAPPTRNSSDVDSPTTTDGTAGTDVIPNTPEEYSTALIETWERGDQDAAARLASPAAVATLFSRDSGGPGQWTLQACEGTAGSSYCTFGAGGDPHVVVRVANEAASRSEANAVNEVRFEG